jgi:hypothetical protein
MLSLKNKFVSTFVHIFRTFSERFVNYFKTFCTRFQNVLYTFSERFVPFFRTFCTLFQNVLWTISKRFVHVFRTFCTLFPNVLWTISKRTDSETDGRISKRTRRTDRQTRHSHKGFSTLNNGNTCDTMYPDSIEIYCFKYIELNLVC